MKSHIAVWFVSQWPLTFGSFHQMETPEDGVLVHGLFMDGFWRGSENMTWTDSIKGEWGACGDRRMLSEWDLETGGCWVNEIWRQADVEWMRFGDRSSHDALFIFSSCQINSSLPMMLYLYSPQVKWTRVFPWCSIYVLPRSNKLESSHDAHTALHGLRPWPPQTSTQPHFTRWPRRPACCSPPVTPPTIYVLAVQLLSDLLQDDWMAKGTALPCQLSEWAKYSATAVTVWLLLCGP